MNVKRYEANDIQEAIAKVKADLGSDAVVLFIKEIKRFRLFRFSCVRKIEVIAGREEQPQAAMNATKLEMIQYELREIKRHIKEIQESSQSVSFQMVLPPTLRQSYQHLIECGVEEEIAQDLTRRLQERLTEKELQDFRCVEDLLLRQIAQMIEVSGPLVAENNKIVAFVGPTGVGKTTTIAKLAANFTLLEKKRVALVTIDTYRIAAVEQLKTYAEIMGIPIEVVFAPKELIPALQKHREKDLVLIDTAGRNPLNELQMKELKTFLGQETNIEVQILISLTTKANEIPEILNRFELNKVHRLILTKLDEVTTFGNLLTAVIQAKRPVSYITTGQNVPEDIELADSLKLARLILTRDTNPFVSKLHEKARSFNGVNCKISNVK